MIRVLWLRWLMRALYRQEDGLRQELAGVSYMLDRNAADQRRVRAQLAVAQLDHRYEVRR